MKIFETILYFLTAIARIIFPGKRQGPKLPDTPFPPIPSNERDRSNPGNDRSHTLTAQTGQSFSYSRQADTNWLGIAGYTLMLAGGAGCVLRYLV